MGPMFRTNGSILIGEGPISIYIYLSKVRLTSYLNFAAKLTKLICKKVCPASY